MEKVSTRVKRGMVFWYNIDSSVDKEDVPGVKVGNRSYKDNLEYGDRPWLVISSDELNFDNGVCSIVPMSSKDTEYNRNSEAHVNFKFKGKESSVLCEHVRTVNTVELKRYYSTLDDNIMKEVDRAIAYTFHIDISHNISLENIESVIDKIVEDKVREAKKRIDSEKIDDTVMRIGVKLESLFSTSAERIEKTEKIEKTDKKVVKRKSPENRKPTSRKWDKESAKSFLKDVESMKVEDVADKWGYPVKSVGKMTGYLRKRYV